MSTPKSSLGTIDVGASAVFVISAAGFFVVVVVALVVVAVFAGTIAVMNGSAHGPGWPPGPSTV